MSNDQIEFVNGLFFKLPNEKAPDFVRGSLSIKPRELIAWLQPMIDDEWVNISLKVAKSGKAYACLDTWKPDNQRQGGETRSQGQSPGRDVPVNGGFDDDQIPF